MSHSDLRKSDCDTFDDTNVIQLGFNISVTGNSASDFQIFVNDKKQSCGQLSIPNLKQITSSAEVIEDEKLSPKTDKKFSGQSPLEALSENEDMATNGSRRQKSEKSPSADITFTAEGIKSSRSEDVTIIDEIKNAMGNFEKFSEHLREIPRLSTQRMSTSTPFPDKSNSRSEGNLSVYGQGPRSYIPKHDFRDRKYFKKPKQLASDLFLKPLPAEDYFKKGFVRRYYDIESYHHYASMESLPHYYDYGCEWKTTEKPTTKSDNDRSDALSSASDVGISESKAISKKECTEPVDKQSTSSESTKDIKIYQSGGIIIMQNFKDSADLIDKRGLLDSDKLIENYNKLTEKMESGLQSSDGSQKLLLNSSSDDVKAQSTKFVQFDLSSCENTRSKSCDSSSDLLKNDCTESLKNSSLNLKNEHSKEKDSGLIFPSNQDFISLSTQENDSVISNILGMSPTSSTSGKKLEWDSGADVGYLNVDLSKENISTIERIILKGLSDDGLSKKKVLYQKTEQETVSRSSKFVEQLPLDLDIYTKNASTGKRSSSDQSSIPNRMADTSTTTSLSLSSHSDGARIHGPKKQKNTGKSTCNNVGAEKHETLSNVKSYKTIHSKKSKKVQNHQSKKHSQFDETKKREIQSVHRTAGVEEKCVQTPSIDISKDVVSSEDKSTYVNTLFSDLCFELPLEDLSRSEESGRSESSDKFGSHLGSSARVKKLKKKRNVAQSTNLTSRLKDRIESINDISKNSSRSDEKEKPNGSIESTEPAEVVNHNTGDEKLQELEDVHAEQKHAKSDPTLMCSVEKANQKDKIARSRPISASSSSVRTVMPNVDAPENANFVDHVKNFSDQMIQTCELMYESKGIQAFQSAKCSAASSQFGDGATSNIEEIPVNISGVEFLKDDSVCKSVLTCSRSIQAPGMNSSLPKHLAHPKLTISCEQMNTKSTQFFGGPVTSLPNYHSNVPMRESATEKVKILKNNVNSNIENRVKQENVKNTSVKRPNESEVVIEYQLAQEDNGNSKLMDDGSGAQRKEVNKGTKKNKNDVENKENLSVNEGDMTDYSIWQSNFSRRESKTNCSVNNGSKKSDSMVFGSCEVLPSDDGKNMFLTSELLKEHGDHIDRNIIQEKYFQSQLVELERKEMISRTTSMEKKSAHEQNTQTVFPPVTGVSVSCQYSPCLLNTSEEIVFYSNEDSVKSSKEKDPRNPWVGQSGPDECDSSHVKRNEKRRKTMAGFSPDEIVLAESLSSGTQTADSWVPGGQQDTESQFVEGKDLHFEYLPEHIYDDPADLKEKSFNETDRNLQMGDSAQSNETYSTPGSNSRVKKTESGHTLVLENTDRSLLESDRMKSLNNNLTELEMVVSRLHKKEAIFQKITDTVLATVSKVNGSGDSPHNERSRSSANSHGTEEICCEVEVMEESNKSNGSEGESRKVQEKVNAVNEVSTACQTDTLKPVPNLLDERKKLEQRMNDEKEQQIKWIEDEIKHLNMLRSLLEKQEDFKNSTQRKKRHHYLTEAAEGRSETSTLKEEILRKILAGSLSKTSSSGDDIANGNHLKSKESPPLKLTEKSTTETLKLSAPLATKSHCAQLGMALSLRRVDNVREVTMLPVGIQVTLRDKKERIRTGSSPEKEKDSLNSEQSGIRLKQTPTISTAQFGRPYETQPPSVNNQYSTTIPAADSVDSMNRCACFKCNKRQCVCLKTTDQLRQASDLSSDRRRSSRSSSQPSKIPAGEPAGMSSTLMSGETFKQGLNIPEIRDIAESRRETTNETPSEEVTRSRDSSKQGQSYISSDGSLPFEKCMCGCHAQPLLRCNNCHLLNTCKKCQCYRKIKCCLCEVSASKAPLRKKCLTVSTSCRCSSDPCQSCRCSSLKNQVCPKCPCHAKAVSESSQCKCKKKFAERSCQTEGKECKCCQCREEFVNEEDLYRETKYMSERKHITEKRKPSDLVYPAEQRYECESKQPVDEKFPYQMKVPMEQKKRTEVKNAMQMKTEVENLCADEFQSLPLKELQGKTQCRCKSRRTRKKNVEDHPRHYFLQVEETTEEESSESCDNRNSLEVITIKVPIRKVCNGGRNVQSSPQRNSWKTKENGDAFPGKKHSDQKMMEGSECDCCDDCIGHSRKRSVFEERPRTADFSPPRASYESKKRLSRVKDICSCCEDCPGRAKLEEIPRPEFAMCDDYEQRKSKSTSYTKFSANDLSERCQNCSEAQSNKPLRYPSNEYRYQETETDFSGFCNCCDCCSTTEDLVRYNSQAFSICPEFRDEETSACPSGIAEVSSTTESEAKRLLRVKEKDHPPEGKKEKNRTGKPKSEKCKKEGDNSKKVQRKSPSPLKPGHSYQSHKSKTVKSPAEEKSNDKCKTNDYYNFNKKEFMTKSELEREEKKRRPTRLTLQECLTVRRPDLYTRAECRRKIISEKSKDRAERHNKRMECLTKLLPQCEPPAKNPDLKLFTSVQMRKQTRKFYKKLPEVTNKQAEEKKKMQFRTNKIMAEIFAKKLQLQTLKGRLNMSNSFTVMSTM